MSGFTNCRFQACNNCSSSSRQAISVCLVHHNSAQFGSRVPLRPDIVHKRGPSTIRGIRPSPKQPGVLENRTIILKSPASLPKGDYLFQSARVPATSRDQRERRPGRVADVSAPSSHADHHGRRDLRCAWGRAPPVVEPVLPWASFGSFSSRSFGCSSTVISHLERVEASAIDHPQAVAVLPRTQCWIT